MNPRWLAQVGKSRPSIPVVDTTAQRKCEHGCGRYVPEDKNECARFCSPRCAGAAWRHKRNVVTPLHQTPEAEL